MLRPISIGIDPALEEWGEEIKYTVRTLMRVAGFPVSFEWAKAAKPVDLYYGHQKDVRAEVRIPACGRPFASLRYVDPEVVYESEGIPILGFNGSKADPVRRIGTRVEFPQDIVFASYWFLSGARETACPWDRWGNVDASCTALIQKELLNKPIVSIYGAFLGRLWNERGFSPRRFALSASFVLSHDVDYPQILRWVECLRLIRQRGLQGGRSIKNIWNGTSHFWGFHDWIQFEQSIGMKAAFYFMVRRGSLLHYALGNPDAFYDVRTPPFQNLFAVLRDAGYEIGLHTSFLAYHGKDMIKKEKEDLQEAAQVQVLGNRHHFWHLDPAAPHQTLRMHEGTFLYDSSLAFDFYPGYRRGICHPFRPFDPELRRELQVLQLPPAWMDNHFDQRLRVNGIHDADRYAKSLLDVAAATGGVVVLDYHARGMNEDMYPKWGHWLEAWARKHVDSSWRKPLPQQVAQEWEKYERDLDTYSADHATCDLPIQIDVQADLSVGLLEPHELGDWDAFVAAHSAGTIYHTSAWQQVTQQGLGHRPYYLCVRGDGGEIVAVLPLFLVKGIFGRRLVSVPMRDRGGILSMNPRASATIIAYLSKLSRDLKCHYVELRSFHEPDIKMMHEHGFVTRRQWITTRIDLSPGVEALWKALDRDFVRWSIKKAAKEGVTFEFDNTVEGMDTFYRLFVQARSAMGIPPFPRALFFEIHAHLVREGKACLALVRKDGIPINAMISLFSRESFIPAYAAPQNLWRKCYPSEVMFWHTIEWAVQQGFRYYDFGADSPRQTGLLRFKQKWGGIQHPMYSVSRTYHGRTLPDFDSSGPAFALMRSAWKRLPASLSQSMGGWITKQMS